MLHPPYVSHQLWPPPQHPVKTLPRWSHGNLPPWLWGSRKYQLNHGNDMNCSSYPVSVFVVIDFIEFQNLICGKQRLLLYFYFATRIPSYSYATSLTFHFFCCAADGLTSNDYLQMVQATPSLGYQDGLTNVANGNTTLQFHPVSVYMWNMYSEWQVKRLMVHSSNAPNVKHPETTTWLISSFWGQQYHFWTETSCISVAMLLAWRVGLDTLGCIWVQPSCYHK